MDRKQRLEANIQLALSWKRSGMTQAGFAQAKGMNLNELRYRIRYARERAPERLISSSLSETEFAQVPEQYIIDPENEEVGTPAGEKPALLLQTSSVSLQVSNQADPLLLKTALEVILSC